MPKVTVIMPSLNVVKYIKPCLESVLAQTLQDMEILAIDAGSDDGTLEVLREYALSDKRIKLIHSEQRSYGYQLNMGIALAQGEYIGVVETDDIIVPDMFEILYKTAVETGVDYVKGTAQAFLETVSGIRVTNKIFCVSDPQQMGKIICPKENPELFVTDRFLWLGIYKAGLLKEVKLNESKGAAFQDIGFAFQVIGKADKALYLGKDVYFYRQDNGNASSHDVKSFQYLVAEYFYVKQFLEGKNVKWHQAYYHKMLNQCLGRFQKMAVQGEFWKQSYSEIEILQSWIRDAVKKEFLAEHLLGYSSWRKTQLFLESAEAVYQEYAIYYNEKKKELAKVLSIVGKRKVIIFGSGQFGRFSHALIESKCLGSVIAYCDNNEKLWDVSIQGVPVLSPADAAHQYPDAIYIISNRRDVEEMRQQLKNLGVADECICRYEVTMDLQLFQM